MSNNDRIEFDGFTFPQSWNVSEEYIFRHWFNGGSLKVKPVFLAGTIHLELSWKGKFVCHYNYYDTVLRALHAGEHDELIGCKASENVPSSVYDWNGAE